MKGLKLEGILPALITPLQADNRSINEKTVERLMESLLRQGADGFYILGGTGEGLVIGREEREQMCELAVRCAAGRKPVVCHIASMNLDETLALARHAERVGCDAVASVPPFFFYYDAEDIYQYYKRIAGSVQIPVIIYYHPAAQREMKAELIARIFEIDNVTGVKWSSGDLFEMMKLRLMTQGDMNIINGPDELLLEGLTAGADAGIGSTYNIMLPQFVRIYRLFREGRIEEARATQMRVNRVVEYLIREEVIPSVKACAELLGFEVGRATFPMRQYSAEDCRRMEQELNRLGWPDFI